MLLFEAAFATENSLTPDYFRLHTGDKILVGEFIVMANLALVYLYARLAASCCTMLSTMRYYMAHQG
jgi:hypothetical protein